MAKTQQTLDIEKELYIQAVSNGEGIYGCPECTLGPAYGNERVDLMTMESSNVFRCYEIKISKTDMNSKAKLSFYGDYNYLVVPESLLEAAKEKFPPYSGIGIYCYHNTYRYITSEQKAHKKVVRIGDRVQLMQDMIRSLARWPYKEIVKGVK